MKVSYSWLKEYIKSETDINEVVEILTNTGLEVGGVEKIEQFKGGLQGLVVGEVVQVEPHPNADRLNLTKVDVGDGSLKSIVCGAPNVKQGQKVVVALPGTTLYPIKGESFKIKTGKIRGEVSEGMICAEDEIGVGESHDGIMVLKKSTEVGLAFKDYVNAQEDYAIEIDLTPNRTDAISHFGVARDYLAVKNLLPGFKKEKISIPDVKNFEVDNNDLAIDVVVMDKEACPRYSGLSMTEVKVEESPAWLQMRLKTIGLSPINNIVDAANYVMYETGQPLHVFDAEEVAGDKVVVKKESKGKKFLTLDGVERNLDEGDLMICNALEPMCIAGVFGGLTSGVKESTTKIFIESAYFTASGIRKTARRHGLSTDASYRYERGGNPDGTIYALKRLSMLIKSLTGAKISSEIVDVYPFKIDQSEVSLRWSYLNTISGKEILKEEVRNIMSSLDIDVMTEDNEAIKLRIPGYRTEVTREIDVVEEVLRIYGYNNIDIPEKMNSSFSFRPAVDGDKLQKELSNMLSSLGFREIMNNSLTSEKHYAGANNLVKVLNPLSNELSVMRSSLLEGGLEAIRYNTNRKSVDLKMYEFGKVYSLSGPETFVEKSKFCIWLTGKFTQETWREKQRPVDFYDAKTIFEKLCNKLGIEGLKMTEHQSESMEYGMKANWNNKELAHFGKVSSKKLTAFDLEKEVYVIEFDWQLMLDCRLQMKTTFKALPKFPSMRRDLALLINDSVNYSEIESKAIEVERNILQEVNLFDVYKGKGIDAGKKSYAVSYIFRDPNKTLTDKQVDKIMEKLVGKYKEELGAELR